MDVETSGMLTKKIHGHEAASVSQPPRLGPIAGPSAAPIPYNELAIGNSSGGKASSISVSVIGMIAPPPMPCKTRKKISDPRFHENPHATEPAMKKTWLMMK